MLSACSNNPTASVKLDQEKTKDNSTYKMATGGQPAAQTIQLGDGIVMECGMFVVSSSDENIYNMFLKKHLPFINTFTEVINVQCQLGGTTLNQIIQSTHTTDFVYGGAGCNFYLRFDNYKVPTSGHVSGFYQVIGRIN